MGDHETKWIVDPLDGTSNYLRGLPDFTVSIGLSVGGETELGVVYRPVSDELFAASKRSEPPDEAVTLGVSDRDAIEEALVAIPYSSRNKDRDRVWETHRYFGSQVEGLRSTGSGALDLANLASGVTDIVYAFDQSEVGSYRRPVLVEIADGVVTGHDGGATSTGDFVASNEKLHESHRPQVSAGWFRLISRDEPVSHRHFRTRTTEEFASSRWNQSRPNRFRPISSNMSNVLSEIPFRSPSNFGAATGSSASFVSVRMSAESASGRREQRGIDRTRRRLRLDRYDRGRV